MKKPFNLDLAKKGQPLVNRLGVPINFLLHIPNAPHFSRICVQHPTGNPYFLSESGTWTEGRETDNDVFLAPQKKTVWVNFYIRRYTESGTGASVFDSASDAEVGHSLSGFERLGGKSYAMEIEV